MKHIKLIFAFVILISNFALAQTKKPVAKKPVPKVSPNAIKAKPTTPNKAGLTTLKSGIKYAIVRKGNGTYSPQEGDHLKIHIRVKANDSALFDTYKMNANEPAPAQCAPVQHNGDVMEVIRLMKQGDSAICYVPKDSVFRQGASSMPDIGKPYNTVSYEIVLVEVVNKEVYEKQKKEESNAQALIDDKELKAYIEKNKIKAMRTASGLYYTITKIGGGKRAQAGSQVTVNYTGKLMDGTKFDSNTDPSFSHVEPFSFTLGKGQVIRGWDEGIALLNEGDQATLLIPSGMAYGANPPQGPIKPNSVLIFDVELVKQPSQEELTAKEDADIVKYIADNKIKNVQKTASGLMYVIEKSTTNASPTNGQSVTMNYTGMLLDGTKFDSNTDPAFGHVQPFDFPLGAGRVIKGWDEGVALLKKGEKAKLIIPSALAYGNRAMGGKIPANSPLIFDVELVDFK